MRYTVKAAARATGVSESRLRTWERRYGIPKPARSETGRRLYDDGDLRVIRRMAALVGAGLPAAQAAEAARAEGAVEPPAPPADQPGTHPLAAALVAAAGRFDEPAAARALDEAVASLGWRAALGAVLFPALRAVGEDWERGALTPAHEHFLSEQVRLRLAAAIVAAAPPGDAPLVVLACPEDERHELGLAALWLLLRLARVRVCYLGADVPPPQLLAAVEALRPDAVCLSATARAALPAVGLAARALVASRVPAALYVGGPAVQGAGDDAGEVPGIRLPAATGAAADLIAERLAAARR